MRKLSIVIPMYNEEKRIKSTLVRVIDFLAIQAYKSEIIIVDDASSDNTCQIVKDINYPRNKINLELLQHAYNKGKGAAVKTGILDANGDYVLFMDADNSTDLKEIKNFLPFIKSYPIIIGSRSINKNSIKVKQSISRRIISRLGNIITNMMFKLDLTDTQCGFKLFEINTAKEIFQRLTIERWAFDIEILVIAKKYHYKIKEIAVDWYDSPSSKLRAGKAVFNTLKEIIKIKHNLKKGKYN